MLKKDLPFAKAGEEFSLHRGGIRDYITLYKNDEEVYQFKVGENVSEMFDEWFENKFDLDEYYYITDDGLIGFAVEEDHNISKQRMLVGNTFITKEEAKKHLAYLKAKEVIRQDAKGFKPDWLDRNQVKYSGNWNLLTSTVGYAWELMYKGSEIYFKSEEDINESIKKHPDEWRTYLTYEQ